MKYLLERALESLKELVENLGPYDEIDEWDLTMYNRAVATANDIQEYLNQLNRLNPRLFDRKANSRPMPESVPDYGLEPLSGRNY